MCLNQVPTYTMCHASSYVPQHVPDASTMHQHMFNHQPCIPSTNHVPYHVSTMYTNTCTIPCINHVHQHMYHIPYTIYHEMCLNYIPYHSIHDIQINQYMKQQCISPSRHQPKCTMHPMMFLIS